MSSQIGWPDGARAECGRAKPNASPTTWERRRRAEEVATSPGRCAGPARLLAGVFQRHFAAGETGPDRLNLSGVLAAGGRQRDAARDQHAGPIEEAGQGHHHRRQPLVAGGHAQNALGGRNAARWRRKTEAASLR